MIDNDNEEQKEDAKGLTKAELIVHPVRLRIIEAVQAGGRTTQQIAALLPEIPQASLYRQIKRLYDAQILAVSEERVVNGIIERTYVLRTGAAHFSRDEFAAIPPEEHSRFFAIFLGVMAAQMERYLKQERYDTTAEGMTYFQAVLNLTDEEARQFRVEMLEMVQRIAQHPQQEGSRPRALTVAFIPEAVPGAESTEKRAEGDEE